MLEIWRICANIVIATIKLNYPDQKNVRVLRNFWRK